MEKTALITGATGQDASYLIEFLLDHDYTIYGLCRRSSRGYDNLVNIAHLINNEEIYRKRLFLRSGDLADTTSLYRIIAEVRPHEIYNLGAQADVQESYFMPDYTVDINGNGVIRLLEAIRNIDPKIKLYQASTSELFGKVDVVPQNEQTPMNPQSPYALGKWVGYQAVKLYRQAYEIFACNGILFNHASERRTDDYLDRKVTKGVARIKYGLQKELRLGNLEAKRDWGYSKEYVEFMHKILQQEQPDDYVIGTGETHTVEEWVAACFKYVGLDWRDYVVIDPALFRAAEVDILQADYTKANKKLGFEPKVKFDQLIKLMMDYDLQVASRTADLRGQ